MQNYTPYPNYQFNPMLSPGQRLMQLEAQYPQFAQQQTPIGQNARAYVVLNKEEANAQQVPTDGSITVFVNKGDNEIYTKGLDNTGLLTFKTYKLMEDTTKEKKETQIISNDFQELKNDIKEIKETIKEFKNAKQPDTNISVNRTTKKQPKPPDDDAADVRE